MFIQCLISKYSYNELIQIDILEKTVQCYSFIVQYYSSKDV